MFLNQFCNFVNLDPDLDPDLSSFVDSDPDLDLDTINPDHNSGKNS